MTIELKKANPEDPVPEGHTRLFAFYRGQMGNEDFIGCVDVADAHLEEDEEEIREQVEELFKDDGGFWGICVMNRDEVVCEFNTYAAALGKEGVEEA